jgi:hypothetical protein
MLMGAVSHFFICFRASMLSRSDKPLVKWSRKPGTYQIAAHFQTPLLIRQIDPQVRYSLTEI